MRDGRPRNPRRPPRSARPDDRRVVLRVEPVEDRSVPSAVPVADVPLTSPVPPTAPAARRELVVIESDVPDAARLAADLAGRSVDGVAYTVVTVDGGGVGAVTAAIGRFHGLDAVHLVSHGTAGGLELGGAWLAAPDAADYAADLAAWGAALRPGGDLLVYGCDLAAGAVGRAFVAELAARTGADVAASTNRTGAAALGADWALEHAAGAVETSAVAAAGWRFALGVTPLTGDIGVDALSGDKDKNADVGVFADGSFVVVWSGVGTDDKDGVFARRYSAAGAAVGSTFLVNQSTGGSQTNPAVAVGPDDAFVVAWEGKGSGGQDVFARRFARDGTALSGEFTVAGGAGDQKAPDVAVDGLNRTVVVWQQTGTGPADGVYARRYLLGTSLGLAVKVSTGTTTQDRPAVAADAAGNYVVAWTDHTTSKSQIRVQVYNGLGLSTATFTAQATPVGNADRAAVAMDAAGNIVVAWQQDGAAANKHDIWVQRFNSSGSPLAAAVRANTTTADEQTEPAVAVTADGDYVVTWTADKQDGDGKGITGQAYLAGGAAAGGEFQVNGGTKKNQSASQVGVSDAGQILVIWNGYNGDKGTAARLFAWPAAGQDPPTIAVTNTPVTYTENDPAVLVAPALAVGGGPILAGATVAITGGFARAEDGLAFNAALAASLGVTGAYDATAGVLTLTGSASAIVYQQLLRTVTFQDTSERPSTAPRTVTFTVTDGTTPATAARTVAVVAVNDPPAGADASVTTAEDTPYAFRLADFPFADADGDTLARIKVVAPPAAGTLRLNGADVIAGQGVSAAQIAAGLLVYAPPADATGTPYTSFRFAVSDGTAFAIADRAMVVAVTPVNDPPIAAADTYSVPGSSLTVAAGAGVRANDADADGDPLTAVLLAGPSHGSLTLNADGSFVYTPDGSFAGSDSFTYRAFDGTAYSAAATVTLVGPGPNAPPAVTMPGPQTVAEDGVLVISAGTGNGFVVSDPDGPARTITFAVTRGTLTLTAMTGMTVVGGRNGSATVTVAWTGGSDVTLNYRPDADYNGPATLTLAASDGLATTTGTTAITVTPANDPPVAADDAYTLDEDGSLTVPAAGVLADDADIDGDALTAAVATGPSNGTLTLNADGSFTYTPTAGFAGTDAFTYRVFDGTAYSGLGTVSLTVRPVNHSPAAAADAFTVAQGATLVAPVNGVLANDADPDGDPLAAVLDTGPANGTLTLNADGSFTYTPATGFAGTDAFTYRATDGTLTGGAVVVTIVVTPTPHPLAADDHYTAAGGATLTAFAGGVLANDTEPTGGPLTAVLVGGPGNGTLTLAADGTFVYTPARGFSGTDSFTYRAVGPTGPSGDATVTIAVAPAAAPFADGAVYVTGEGTTLDVPAPGLLADAPAGSALVTLLVTRPNHGTVTANADGSFRYVPDAGFGGVDHFVYDADTGGGFAGPVRVTVIVTPDPGRAPRVRGNTYDVPAGGVLVVSDPAAGVLGNDRTFRGPLAAVLVSGPQHGTLTMSDDGAFSYVPDAGFVGTDRFVYRATDGVSGDLAVVVLTVNGPAPAAGQPAAGPPATAVPPAAAPPAQSSTPAAVAPLGPVSDAPAGGAAAPSPPTAVTTDPPPPGAADPVGSSFGGTAGGAAEPAAPPAAAVGGAKPAPVEPKAVAAPPAPPSPAPSSTPSVASAPPPAPAVAPTAGFVAVPPSIGDNVLTSLDVLGGDVTETPRAVAYTDTAVVSVGVGVAGYVLLNTRAVYWFLSALLARPAAWRQFDPLDVIYAWEAGKGKRAGRADDETESLQSMVAG